MTSKPYTDWCDECNTEMNIRSKDSTLIYCPNCFVPKPVPLTHVTNNARLLELRRLKKVHTDRYK